MKNRKLIGVFLSFAIILTGLPMSQPVESSAKTIIYPTEATGEQVKESKNCVIDYSNSQDGYVMVKFKKALGPTLKCVVTTGGQALNDGYKYTLAVDKFQVIPLTEGTNTYHIYLLYEVAGRYASEMTMELDVTLADQFGPYLRPNQFVNYNSSTKAVKKAASITRNCKNDLAKVKKVYNYVIKNFKYDKKKARSVQPGYVPNLNSVYKKKKGICFDYAAIMTAMLRSQGVPTKLIVGYTGNAYHAWINVYSKKKGRISKMIYFNGKKWKLMDPTFASSSKSSKSIMKYIGNGRNYKEKLSY